MPKDFDSKTDRAQPTAEGEQTVPLAEAPVSTPPEGPAPRRGRGRRRALLALVAVAVLAAAGW